MNCQQSCRRGEWKASKTGPRKDKKTGLKSGCEGPLRAGNHEGDPSLGDEVIFSSRDGRPWGWSHAEELGSLGWTEGAARNLDACCREDSPGGSWPTRRA